MSAGGAFGGARGVAPKAPDKGVFPLDHFGECKKVRGKYPDWCACSMLCCAKSPGRGQRRSRHVWKTCAMGTHCERSAERR